MNKKLLAMLFVVALAPMSQSFAGDKDKGKFGTFDKVRAALGLGPQSETNKSWNIANTVFYAGGGLLALGSGIYLGVKGYQDPENTGDATAAFWTLDGEGVSAAMEQNADVIYANIGLATGAGLVCGKLIWDGGKWVLGYGKNVKTLMSDRKAKLKELNKLNKKNKWVTKKTRTTDDDEIDEPVVFKLEDISTPGKVNKLFEGVSDDTKQKAAKKCKAIFKFLKANRKELKGLMKKKKWAAKFGDDEGAKKKTR